MPSTVTGPAAATRPARAGAAPEDGHRNVSSPTSFSRLQPNGPGPRLAAAVLSGALVALALPPYDVAVLAPCGVALLTVLCRGRSARMGALLGLAHGLGVFVPVFSWLTVVGPDAWLALAVLEALFVAAAGAVTPVLLRLRGWPVWVACLWVLEEALRDRLPFGGLPWARLAFAETASPLTPYAAIGGAPLVTMVTALCGTLLAAGLLALRQQSSRRGAAVLLGLTLLLPALGAVLPVGVVASGRSVTVALVQGNVPRIGLQIETAPEQVLRNHVAATHRLAAAVRAGRRAAPDLVIWPENASDIDPLTTPSARALVDGAVRDVGVPVLVGALLDGPGPDHVSNAGIVWDPVTGPGERYVKRHPVPFGEYIPFRAQLTKVISRLDQIPRDFAAGTRPGNLTVGPARVGDVICFEVAYDGLVRDVVRGGAQVLVVQTNNATYNGTGQPAQQMAMSRLRAVEAGRDVLVTATSGISAVVRADGSVARQAPERVARTLVARVGLRDGQTLATRLGPWPERGLALVALLAIAIGLRSGRRAGGAR